MAEFGTPATAGLLGRKGGGGRVLGGLRAVGGLGPTALLVGESISSTGVAGTLEPRTLGIARRDDSGGEEEELFVLSMKLDGLLERWLPFTSDVRSADESETSAELEESVLLERCTVALPMEMLLPEERRLEWRLGSVP